LYTQDCPLCILGSAVCQLGPLIHCGDVLSDVMISWFDLLKPETEKYDILDCVHNSRKYHNVSAV
jgi:hypothetical protein